MKKIITLLLLAASSSYSFAQTVLMEEIELPSYTVMGVIGSGDTIEYNTAGDVFEMPIRLTFSGVASGNVSFRVKEISTNPCVMDQICGFLFPDPGFQGSCWSPNNANYTTPTMSGINFAAGDTVLVKPIGSFSCGACAQFRYFIRLDGVEIDSFDLKVCSTLALEDEAKEELDMNAFPNPASNQLTINTTGIDGNVELRITDVLGKVVYDETVGTTKKLDVSSFKNGVYLVTVLDKGKLIKTKRVVIKH
jgi:hypothetical protein